MKQKILLILVTLIIFFIVCSGCGLESYVIDNYHQTSRSSEYFQYLRFYDEVMTVENGVSTLSLKVGNTYSDSLSGSFAADIYFEDEFINSTTFSMPTEYYGQVLTSYFDTIIEDFDYIEYRPLNIEVDRGLA